MHASLWAANSLSGLNKLGCFCMTCKNGSRGSCSKASKEWGCVILAHRMKPSQSWGVLQIFLVMSLISKVLDT